MKRIEIAAQDWITTLGARCASTIKTEESVLRAKDYAKGFGDMAPEVFCDASGEAAARHFEYFPSYATLRKWLEDWWRSNKPRPPELPGYDDASLELEDRLWLKRWTDDRMVHFPHLKDKGTPAERMALSLSSMRIHAPRTFRYLARTDSEVASIAVRRGWEVEIVHHVRTSEEIAWANDLVRNTVHGMRGKPPAGPPTTVDAYEQARLDAAALHARMTSAVPAHVLAAARDANPGVQKARAQQATMREAEKWVPDWER